MKTLSSYGLQLLKQFEGCKLEAYLDSGGVPTIGVGHIRGVKIGDVITEAKADEMLHGDLVRYESCVNSYVIVPINQNQYDALICFAFNLGCGALKSSTLLRQLNTLKYNKAADQFLRWDKVRIKGKLEKLSGLTNRRAAERRLFVKEGTA